MSGDTAEPEMRVDPARASELLQNLKQVTSRIANVSPSGKQVRLILVSKLKPASDILALHQHPELRSQPPTHFGENYFQELQHKAAILPKSIRWHFIGALQSNKCKPLAESVSNLWCVSSVDSAKKADQLEKGRKALLESGGGGGGGGGVSEKLRVQVQVNTSGEREKSGVEPGDETVALCRHIVEQCPHLQLSGLMTIGAIARSQATTPETENEDFDRLRQARDVVCEQLGPAAGRLQLSMGMSSDFEGAIAQGSDEVRVGTTIFGQRPAKGDAQAKEQAEQAKS